MERLENWRNHLMLVLLAAGVIALGCGGCKGENDGFGEGGDDDDAGDDDAGDDDAGSDDDATAGDDDATAGDDDGTPPDDPCEDGESEPCCNDTQERLYLCLLPNFPIDTPVKGTFSAWGSFGHTDQFVTDGGDTYEVHVDGSDDALFFTPDMVAEGPVSVIMQGSCDGDVVWDAAYYIYKGEYPGEHLLLAGNTSAQDLGEWTVDAAPDVDSCFPRPGDDCNQFVHNRPVTLQHGDDTWTEYMGALVVTEDFAIRVGQAQSGSGDFYDCEDSLRDQTTWYVVPADVGTRIPPR